MKSLEEDHRCTSDGCQNDRLPFSQFCGTHAPRDGVTAAPNASPAHPGNAPPEADLDAHVAWLIRAKQYFWGHSVEEATRIAEEWREMVQTRKEVDRLRAAKEAAPTPSVACLCSPDDQEEWCPHHGRLEYLRDEYRRLRRDEDERAAPSSRVTPEEWPIDYAALDPGIRGFVRWLVSHGFATTDSGDGVTKPAAGNDECETEPHVYMLVDAADMVAEAHRLRALLGPAGRIQVTYSPDDKVAMLSVHEVDDATPKGSAAKP